MAHGRRSRAAERFGPRDGEATAVRESLERRWFRRQEAAPELAELVTGASLGNESYHRWLAYKQAFAPALVRLFLEQVPLDTDAPLLDPFSGSGTFAIECARRGVPALGIDTLPSLVYLTNSRSASECPPLPDLSRCTTWQEFAETLNTPIHRAALICAFARQHSSDGKPLRNPPELSDELHAVVEMMGEDLRKPLAAPLAAEAGDARDMNGVADDSIAGILTSPPYLSRHDYTRVTRPHEQVYRYWQPAETQSQQRQTQVRAHPRAYHRDWGHAAHPAAEEAYEALRDRCEGKSAGIVRSYFDDLTAALREFARVLRGGGPCWLVLAGARLKNVYVPSDTIMADIAQDCGFTVVELRVARRLIGIGRNFGSLTNVSPRETLIVLRRKERAVD